MGANLTIYKKGLVLILIPLLSQAIFIGVLTLIRADEAQAQRDAFRSKQVVVEAERLYGALADAHSAVRGHLLTGDPAFTRPYRDARRQVPDRLGALEELVGDHPDQPGRVRAIAVRARRLLDWLGELYALARAGRRDEAVRRFRAGSGLGLIRDLRADLDAFLAEEERLNGQRVAALEGQAALQNRVLVGGGVLALASTALLGAAFARGIASRLAVLADNSRRLAEGKELLAPLQGGDELARLDRVFRDMAGTLAQRNQENEMFVYSVSHDLRSPLVNLQGFSQELALDCRAVRDLLARPGVPEPVRAEAGELIDRHMAESIHFIRNAVGRLSAIIDALLRLSRAGRVEYRWQMVDVHAIVHRVVEALRGTLKGKGAAVRVGPLPPAWGDPTALEQVFANLIGNAAHYLDPGRPGTIEVGAEEPAGTGPPGGPRRYFVRDNGLGIPEAQWDKVFIAFQRLHPDAGAGEGVGLALVRRVVERHRGRIWLESAEGAGTTFYVELPAGPPPEEVVRPRAGLTHGVAP
jgi:signal transduction histidine kinase